MIRILAAAGMCLAGVSVLGAQASPPGIGQLTRADVYLDGTNMGDKSSVEQSAQVTATR
jgi:hypothetical protein